MGNDSTSIFLRDSPCMVVYKENVYLMGGRDPQGRPIGLGHYWNHHKKKWEQFPLNTARHSAECAVNYLEDKPRIWLAGGQGLVLE